MNSLWILSLLVLVCFAQQETNERFQKMVAKNSKGGLLVLSTKTLLNIVNDNRNYSLVIYFGSTSSQQPCEYCRMVEPQFKRLFKAYHNFVGGESAYHSSSFRQHPVFFATCNIPDCAEAAILGGLETIPQINLLESPTKPSSDKKYLMDKAPIGGPIDVYGLADWLYHKTGQLVAKKPFYEENAEMIAYVGILAGAVLLLPKLWTKRRDPMIWYCVALCAFVIVMAGTIYNAIRGAPFWHVGRDGNPIFIYPSARDQFVVEGYLMASIITGMGLLIVGLNVLIPWVQNAWTRRILVVIHLGLFAYGFNFIRDVIRKKYGHYPI